MAWHYPADNIAGSGSSPAIDLGKSDSVFVAQGITITSGSYISAAAAIRGTGSSQSVFIDGAVAGGGSSVMLGDSASSDSNNYVEVMESGKVYNGDNSGILVFGIDSHVVNRGTIFAEIGIVIVAGSATGTFSVENYGSIRSSYIGVDFQESAQAVEFTNSGMVQGGAGAAVAATVGDDVLLNDGSMSGGVSLGAGDDVFDGRKGTLNSQRIDGSAGADRIWAGAGSAGISGGEGNDTVSGGVGADTFYFVTGYDKEVVTDFVAGGKSHDFLHFGYWDGIDTFKEVKNHASQHGKDLWISGEGQDVMILKHTRVDDLSKADFIF